MNKTENPTETATLGGGCFWCTEAIYLRIKGVKKVTPGYTGGLVKNPTYRQVTTGKSGHAEVVQVVFNPEEITYREILEVFFATHDPTTLNRQGADEGTQYRSAIFTHSPEQEKTAKRLIKELKGSYKDPIVTQVEPVTEFYEAEDYHKNYYETHKNLPYCRLVINPKIDKLMKSHKDKIV